MILWTWPRRLASQGKSAPMVSARVPKGNCSLPEPRYVVLAGTAVCVRVSRKAAWHIRTLQVDRWFHRGHFERRSACWFFHHPLGYTLRVPAASGGVKRVRRKPLTGRTSHPPPLGQPAIPGTAAPRMNTTLPPPPGVDPYARYKRRRRVKTGTRTGKPKRLRSARLGKYADVKNHFLQRWVRYWVAPQEEDVGGCAKPLATDKDAKPLSERKRRKDETTP